MKHPARTAGPGLLPGLLGATLLAFAGPTLADGPRTVHVRTTDLDLSRPADRRLLQRRIEAAIEKVCVPPRSAVLPNVRTRAAVDACREQARADVRRQLQRRGTPELPASHG